MQGEAGDLTTNVEETPVQSIRHATLDLSSSSQPVEESLLDLQPEPYQDLVMLHSGTSFPLNPISAYGLGGIPEFYFGNDAFGNTTLPMLEQESGGFENPVSTFATLGFSAGTDARDDNDDDGDGDILIAEYVPHVPQIDIETYDQMIRMLIAGKSSTDAEHLTKSFPSLHYIDSYVQLYFEHFHRRWPILHGPTFQTSPATWELVFSIAFIGCQFSGAGRKSRHLNSFYQLTPQVFDMNVSLDNERELKSSADNTSRGKSSTRTP